MGKEIACVGDKTAQKSDGIVLRRNIVVPEKFSAKGLIDFYKSQRHQWKKILLPPRKSCGKTLSEELTAMGADVKKSGCL
ncbi:MAG: uroporphyrinogen-III synthase [Ignavibacteriales bacterium]|nr:uroporphyrinogen-III synthase [Ignavibacteriales bacterium]